MRFGRRLRRSDGVAIQEEKEMDTFSTYHPLINLLYYVFVIGMSMFFMHPVLLGISLISAISYLLYLKGRKALRFLLLGMLPAFLLTAVLNPVFTHQGVTILFYMKNGNPVTLESIVYGVGSGFMMASVLCWFSSFHEIMTSDKFMYLFGKTIPAASLLLSMVLRFVPRFTVQIKKISQAQECIGRDISHGSFPERAHHGFTIFSIAVTWALENSVETADSMKSRGYGLRGRTNFSLYRFDSRDKMLLAFLCAEAAAVLLMIGADWLRILYYPGFTMNGWNLKAFAGYALFAMFCMTPLILNVGEDLKWHYLKSKI